MKLYTHLRWCTSCVHKVVIASGGLLSSPMGAISDARLKYSSFRRWNSTSTLETAKEIPFSLKRHGFDKKVIL